MQRFHADIVQQRTRLIAHFPRCWWNVGQAVGQNCEIKSGSTDKDGRAPHGARFSQRICGIIAPAAYGIGLAGAHMAVKQVGRERLVRGAGLCGKDRSLAIDLHGIGIDHHIAYFLGQFQRRGRLAAGSGACNKHGIKFHVARMFLLNVIGKGAEPGLFRGLDNGPANILSPSFAFDLPVAECESLAEARARANGLELDINLVSTDRRRKKLLVADMDSTIINVECLDELADMAGLKPQIAAITERAMRGELEFEGALRERVGMLKGLKLDALERTYAERVRLNPGARSLLATMRVHGAHTMLVSGGFGYFTRRVAEAAGFHAERGNTLLDDGERLTGEVGMPILGREAKLQALEDAVAAMKIDFAETLAVGDGANDLAMIKRAGLGVAYHAKPVVAAAAGAAINHNDLTALLYLQGYADDEIFRAD